MFSGKKQKKFFLKLSKHSLGTQRKVLHRCPNKIISDLRNLCKKICKDKNIKLNKTQVKKLFKFRKFLRDISKSKSVNTTRQFIAKRMTGGFLGSLISVLISIAASLVPTLL